MVDFEYKENYVFENLVELVTILRKECPWDKEQTHRSIRRNLLEEAYEAAEAIDLEDTNLLKEELGDVLLQVVFHAQIEDELGSFDVGAVCTGVCKKLIERHPHIFGGGLASTTSEVLDRWDKIKREQKGQATHTEAIESIARSLPALWRADKTLDKARKAGFDFWEIEESEHKASLSFASANQSDASHLLEEQLGDFLFVAVGLAGRFNTDPELALERTCDKFLERFSYMERKALENEKQLNELTINELRHLWLEAKSEKP